MAICYGKTVHKVDEQEVQVQEFLNVIDLNC